MTKYIYEVGFQHFTSLKAAKKAANAHARRGDMADVVKFIAASNGVKLVNLGRVHTAMPARRF